jgi:peptidoglycan/xylan/chitin deacetylase (PgdA/CDA1 family)
LVRERLLPLGSTERDAYVDELLGWSGRALAPRDTHRLLLRREVVELSRIPGCTIGAHSVSHPWLPRRPVQEQQSELERCRADLEGLIARPVDGFAYPFGAHDEQTVSLVRQAGYRLAVTTEARSLGSSDSPLRLPRLPAPRQAGNEFSRFLAGVLA